MGLNKEADRTPLHSLLLSIKEGNPNKLNRQTQYRTCFNTKWHQI